MTNLCAGLMPIQVEGNVQYLVNRNSRGWILTLIDNEGLYKPQLGLSRIDRGKSVGARIRTRLRVQSSTEWLTGRKVAWQRVKDWNVAEVILPVYGIEIIELLAD